MLGCGSCGWRWRWEGGLCRVLEGFGMAFFWFGFGGGFFGCVVGNFLGGVGCLLISILVWSVCVWRVIDSGV